MRTLGLLLVAAVASADAAQDRTLALAKAYAKRGADAADAARAAKTTGQRLHAFRRAEFLLRRANDLAAKTPDLGLQSRVHVSLVETNIQMAGAYYERKSLPSARRSVEAALKLDPDSVKARALLAAIERAEDEDIFDSVDGVVAIDRVKARRLAAGAPLRDRGRSRER